MNSEESGQFRSVALTEHQASQLDRVVELLEEIKELNAHNADRVVAAAARRGGTTVEINIVQAQQQGES